MENSPSHINKSLLPLSWLYEMGVNFRNKLFDTGILKQKKYDIPIICVGNLTVGGTGKTPHIEYLIEMLSSRYKVAVLSRGYKRKSKGFTIVDENSNPMYVGDEPLQIKQKHPDTLVVVDKKRTHAIDKILTIDKSERPDVILLDDGFQHRYVQPSLSILLVDSNRPVFEDKSLPAGRLREPIKGKSRANIVLVTKCSRNMQPIDFRIFANGMDLFPYQALYFTKFDYKDAKPVYSEHSRPEFSLNDLRKKHVLLIAGIASPQPLAKKLEKYTYNLHTAFFPDHHSFTEKDIRNIQEQFNAIDDDDKMILTTEKDAVRLKGLSLPEELKKALYFLPIEVTFVYKEEKESFTKKIQNHVRSYQTNSRLSKR